MLNYCTPQKVGTPRGNFQTTAFPNGKMIREMSLAEVRANMTY